MFALRASLVFRSFSTTIPVPKKKGDYIPRHRPSKQQKAVIVSQESERLASEVIKHSLSNEQQALLDHVVESGLVLPSPPPTPPFALVFSVLEG